VGKLFAAAAESIGFGLRVGSKNAGVSVENAPYDGANHRIGKIGEKAQTTKIDTRGGRQAVSFNQTW